jgi:hypothetical protein
MAAPRTIVFAFFALASPAILFVAAFAGTADSIPRIPGPIGNHIASYSQFYGSLVMVFGWVLYLWDVTRNPRVPKGKRSLWSAVLLLGGPMALPFYFWHYVRGVAPAAQVVGPSSAMPL